MSAVWGNALAGDRHEASAEPGRLRSARQAQKEVTPGLNTAKGKEAPEAPEIAASIQKSAAKQARARPLEVLLSAVVGGLDVGFAPLSFAFVASHLIASVGQNVAFLIGALVYPSGFIFVVLGRSRLFTESTLTPVVAVFSGASNLRWLARQWALVIGGNLLGALAFAAIIAYSGPLAERYGPILVTSTHELLAFSFGAAFLSGVLAGWVMALLTWLLAVADTTLSRIAFVWLATFVIGAAPLHHSISGAAEVLLTVLLGQASVADWLWRFQVPVTLGNALGGVVMVGALKWLQARASEQSPFSR